VSEGDAEEGDDEDTLERPDLMIPFEALPPIDQFQRLLERPNPSYTGRQLLHKTQVRLDFAGAAAWYLEGATSGLPTALYGISPTRMWPSLAKSGELIGWVMDANSPNPVAFDKREILWFTTGSEADDDVWGVSVVESVYSQVPLVRGTLIAYAALLAALLLRYRVIRPVELLARPWRVVSNDDIGGSVRLLRVRPDGHPGFRFEGGQFAWLMTGSTPLISAQHPLSIACSSVPGDAPGLEFAIKALGDWSAGMVPALRPGRRIWVDGPYGGFTPDPASSRPLVLIAGGIGIVPARSILLTMRDRGDTRQVHLLYAASDWSRVVFRNEIADLERTLDVHVSYVFENPDREWTGERGFITADMLRRRLPPALAECEFFVCGPVPMIDALERTLTTLGVPTNRIHTERFQMV